MLTLSWSSPRVNTIRSADHLNIHDGADRSTCGNPPRGPIPVRMPPADRNGRVFSGDSRPGNRNTKPTPPCWNEVAAIGPHASSCWSYSASWPFAGSWGSTSIKTPGISRPPARTDGAGSTRHALAGGKAGTGQRSGRHSVSRCPTPPDRRIRGSSRIVVPTPSNTAVPGSGMFAMVIGVLGLLS